MEMQPKNINDGNTEGKVRVKNKTIHCFRFSSEDKSGKQTELKKMMKTKDDHEKSRKKW